ncbi:MAG: YkvA family protein [Termitinemataceae bacterium]
MTIKETVKRIARSARESLSALYYASQHPETGLLARVLIGITIAYALSPIDLIPDVIPILGYLDDLIIVPLLVTISIACIPPQVLQVCRERARQEPVQFTKNWKAAIFILLLWGLVVVLILKTTGLVRFG